MAKDCLTRDLRISMFTFEGDYEGLEELDRGRRGDKTPLKEYTHILGDEEGVISQTMDEVALEKATEQQGDQNSQNMQIRYEDRDVPLFALPSGLTLIQVASELDIFEASMAARMAALPNPCALNCLGLPSDPTFPPARRSTIRALPHFTREDIETWCVICQDDATLKFLGCDGDLNCATCWKEGHVGPYIGYEQRGHKWIGFQNRN